MQLKQYFTRYGYYFSPVQWSGASKKNNTKVSASVKEFYNIINDSNQTIMRLRIFIGLSSLLFKNSSRWRCTDVNFLDAAILVWESLLFIGHSLLLVLSCYIYMILLGAIWRGSRASGKSKGIYPERKCLHCYTSGDLCFSVFL